MKKIELEEQKQIQLNILRKVDAFCREHNLRYSLGGGTLLGAVRHKGFIPWDDDIDIMMPRPDYDRFVRSFNGYDGDLTCGAYEIDSSWLYPFCKVYHNKTIMRELYSYNVGVGVFIDVFPIDGFPDDEKERSKYVKTLEFWRRLLAAVYLWEHNNKKLKGLIYKMFSFFIPSSFVQHCFAKEIKKYPFASTSYSGATSGVYQEKECYPHTLFEEYTYDLIFEDDHFMSIKNYDLYLKQHYGNYMQLPPIERRVAPHASCVYYQ